MDSLLILVHLLVVLLGHAVSMPLEGHSDTRVLAKGES